MPEVVLFCLLMSFTDGVILICSHFDGVRALAFHPVEPVLITASEDHTLKLWNLQKTVPAKKWVQMILQAEWK